MSAMGEASKQVRVDNWGVFFLQRLQLFFNKTDYCDLTLQFEGNVQLKVHRLVLNACTDYFNVLEQTCEVIDGNTIIMPDDLQTDVILPIVNFMYTGMLEFSVNIYEKLYHTAELMNIPILTKLLDAQKKPAPKTLNKKFQPNFQSPARKVMPKPDDIPSTLSRKLPLWKRKSLPLTPQRISSPSGYSESKKTIPLDPLALVDNPPKPTRFEWPEEELSSTFNFMDTSISSFDDITYSSKPLLTQEDELRASTSFDDVRNSQTNQKKSKDYNSQPIDINEVKDYVKEQRIRSDLTEFDDDDADDPDGYLGTSDNKRKSTVDLSPTNSKRVRFSIEEKENNETTISITPRTPGEVDHTKIISEVLKKYPHLVKKNKNIKLKILAKGAVSKSDVQRQKPPSTIKVQVAAPKSSPKHVKSASKVSKTPHDEGPWLCKKCGSSGEEPVEFVLYYLYRKHMTDVHHEKFDSKMCPHCGHQSSKHNLLMYHMYTKHGVKPPPVYNFPKCQRCPYIALTETYLQKHLQNHPPYDSQCSECKIAFNSKTSLANHMQITGHSTKTGTGRYDCQYCSRRFISTGELISHIRYNHHAEARRDGLVSIEVDVDDTEEHVDDETTEYVLPDNKVKVVSNVTMASSNHQSQTMTSSSAEIIGNLGQGLQANNLGIVDIVVLDENQQYILHNDQQLVSQQSLVNNQTEYILPQMSTQHAFAQGQNMGEVIATQQNVITQAMLGTSEIASTDELVMVLTDHDYNDGNNGLLTNDNSNIVVLYSHPVDGQPNQFITSEGKLMLNSQTGMLELRSENSADSQDSQIESIELIRREINSGLIQQRTEAEQTEEVPHIEHDNEQVIVSLPSQLEQVDSEPQEVMQTEEIISSELQTEAYQSEEIVDLKPPLQKSNQEPMEVEEGPEINLEKDISEKLDALPDLSEATEEVPQQVNQEDSFVPIPDDHATDKVVESSVEQGQEIEELQISTDGLEISENNSDLIFNNPVETAIPTKVVGLEIAGDAPDLPANTIGVDTDNDVVNDANIPQSAEHSNNGESITENDENPKNSSEEITSPSTTEGVVENYSVQNIKSPESIQSVENAELSTTPDEPTLPDPATIESIASNSEDTVESTPISEQHERGVQQFESETSENPDDVQENAPSDEDIEENLSKESNKTPEHHTENIVCHEGEPDNSIAEEQEVKEIDDVHMDEISKEIEDHNADENSQSQDSQTSQGSSRVSDIDRVEPSQSTKISILNDWDDTENSQQSDNTMQKAENTVNKLIDDWDDDDDDGPGADS